MSQAMTRILVASLFATPISCIDAFAQALPEAAAFSPTPAAASINSYGDIPVSPYSGRHNLTIPVYEIKFGRHSIPISLKYDSGGVRPDELPGWVGLNWMLDAGGCITREVRSMVDEMAVQDPAVKGYDGHIGYFYRYATVDSIRKSSDDMTHLLIDQAEKASGLDYEPDKFFFHFLDYHGFFFLSDNGEWKASCDRPIKISFSGEFTAECCIDNGKNSLSLKNTQYDRSGTLNSRHYFKGFTITGEDGTVYVFGGNESAIEFSGNLFNQKWDALVATAWHLSEIRYVDGRTVHFTYSQPDLMMQLYESDSWSSIDAGEDREEGGVTIPYGGHLMRPCYLQSINYPGGSLYFSSPAASDLQYPQTKVNYITEGYATEFEDKFNILKRYFMPVVSGISGEDFPLCLNSLKRHKLSMISVSDNNSGYHGKISFNYSENDESRLLLKDITFSANGCQPLIFSFDYESPEKLPGYLSGMTDHWGYYNNRAPLRVHQNGYEDSREPNPDCAKYGILSSVRYPTGGYTRFEYESHSYSRTVSERRDRLNDCQQRFAGGLRIKRIINSAGSEDSEFVAKEFFYPEIYDGVNIAKSGTSGILTQPYRYNCVERAYPTHDFGVQYLSISMKASCSFLPGLNGMYGSHIEYPIVIERLGDGSYSVKEFTSYDDGNADSPVIASLLNSPSIYEPAGSMNFARGLLKRQRNFDSDNKITDETVFRYEKSSTDSMLIFSAKTTAHFGKYQCRQGSVHSEYLCRMRPSDISETIFENGAATGLKTETHFDYNGFNQLSKVTVSHPDHTRDINQIFYSSDISTENGLNADKEMLNLNILSLPKLKISSFIGLDGKEHVASKEKITYSRGFYFAPSNIQLSEYGSALNSQERFTFDSFGNVQSHIATNGIETDYIYGFSGTKILASITGSNLKSVSRRLEEYGDDLNSIGDSGNPDYAPIYSLLGQDGKSPLGFATVYEYSSSGNLSRIIFPDGTERKFRYDQMGRMTAILDKDNNILESFQIDFPK